jgi:hypothetical protein
MDDIASITLELKSAIILYRFPVVNHNLAINIDRLELYDIAKNSIESGFCSGYCYIFFKFGAF